MQPRTETSTWYVLRLYKGDNPDETLFVKDLNNNYGRRSWWLTPTFSEAYKFGDRSDARRTARAKDIVDKLADGFFWEVVRVRETKQITYEAEFIVSNAPPLFQLARAAQ